MGLLNEKNVVLSILVILALIVIIDLNSPKNKSPNTLGSDVSTADVTEFNVAAPIETSTVTTTEQQKQEDEIKLAISRYLSKEYEWTEKEDAILRTIPSASVFMYQLGNKEIYDEVISASKQLLGLLAEKEAVDIPPGYEKSHEYSIKATQTYVEYARTLADGIYYKDTQKIKDATGKLREANGYLDLSGELMPKKRQRYE